MHDFITFINESEYVDWNLMKPDIYAVVLEYLCNSFWEISSKEVGYEKKKPHEVMTISNC